MMRAMRHEDLVDYPCTIIRPLAVLGDRWTFMLVKQAFAGSRRFEEFHAAIGISRGRLAERLARLVEEGILVREPYNDGGSRHEYRLTQKGHDLYPVLLALRDWGNRYMAPEGPPVLYRHRDCGGEVHTHLACERCGAEVTARDVRPEPGPGLEPYFSGERSAPVALASGERALRPG
jgi:DNA-binding HxlR family transcriptional regulator